MVHANFTVTIGAELQNGNHIFGQNEISHPKVAGADTKLSGELPMPSRVERIFFVSQHGQEMTGGMQACPDVLQALSDADCIVYGMGSLFTSLVPSLCLCGVGERIR